MESTLELIFGSGRYGCLGRHIALIELDKVLPVLLREFDWSLVDPQKGFHSQCYGVFVQRGLWLRAVARREQ
jgi:cytochrome P450